MWLSTTKVAKIEGVTTQTIREWVKAGKYEECELPLAKELEAS